MAGGSSPRHGANNRSTIWLPLRRRRGARGRIVPLVLDITDGRAVADALAAIAATHGPVALAILNAGTYAPDRAESWTAAAFETLVKLNLMGTAHCLEAVMPAMIARRCGHIAVVSSVAGYGGLPLSIGYGATKAALNAMTESLKFDLDRHEVRIQLVCPGFIRTPLTATNTFPMPALMEVDAAASALVKGLSRRGFEITFPRRFTFGLKLLRLLPYAAYFPLVKRMTGQR